MADEIKAANQQGAFPNPDGARTGAPAGAIQSEPPRPTSPDARSDEKTPQAPPFFQRHFHAFVGGGLGLAAGLTLWFTGTDWKLAIVVGLLAAFILAQLSRFLIRWPQVAHAQQPHYPPGMRPSDSAGREVVETIVFVVVLVLMLKSYAAEAFVIPTGSMAETLWGYQKVVTCPTCKHKFPVNCSDEVDPQNQRMRRPILGCVCPNCRQKIQLNNPKYPLASGGRQPDVVEIDDPGWNSGDRVLVAKFFNEVGKKPGRMDVVVFKFPREPQKDFSPHNYIKRLIGLPGETIAICGGDLYVLPPEKTPTPFKDEDEKWSPLERWKHSSDDFGEKKYDFLHQDHPSAIALFEKPGNFQIIRKSPIVLMAMSRLVHDAEHPAPFDKQHPRWKPDRTGAWEPQGNGFRHGSRVDEKDQISWVYYQHTVRNTAGKVATTLITDFMGYNSNVAAEPVPADHDDEKREWKLPKEWGENGGNWVGDLILECEAEIEKAEGAFVLQLVRGRDQFRATFDLSSPEGTCKLTRLDMDTREEQVLGTAPTGVRKGNYRLRLANVDQRLTLWVDNKLPFDDGVVYDPPKTHGPTVHDRDRPAGFGVSGGAAVSVRKIKLLRDGYYTRDARHPDANVNDLANPDHWGPLREQRPLTLYVQPGHYLCLGDNSTASSDGRDWGLVPERLMQGRALLIYYPFGRAGRIH